MNNFFYEESDFALFKKALKTTDNEPVVVNILSSDPSLKTDEKPKPVERKNASNYKENYQPNTYDRLFGPRRRTPQSVDLNNFSGWKNKNFRKTEQNLDKQESQPRFSLAEYMNQRLGKNKFNSVDTSKHENQKSIDKIGADDPQYRKFYLDSYMTKLEQESKVKQKYDEDILSPLGEDNLQKIVPDSSQDEEFGYNETSAKQVSEDMNVSGERFRIEPSEFDIIKKKIEDKKKRDEGRTKPEQYTLDPNEDFDLSKFKFDDEPDANESAKDEPNKEELKKEEPKKEEPEKKQEFRSRGNSILARRMEQMQKQREANRQAEKNQDDKFKQIEQLQEKVDRLIRLTESKPESQREEALEQGKSRIVVETQATRREVDEMYIKRLDEYFKRVKQEEAREKRRKKREELNNALKVSLQKSEIEMNKKLLEIASIQGKDESIKRRSSKKLKPEVEGEKNKVVIVNNLDGGKGSDTAESKVLGLAGGAGGTGIIASGATNVSIKVEPATPRKKRKYNPKRHMDSDIVGNIDF